MRKTCYPSVIQKLMKSVHSHRKQVVKTGQKPESAGVRPPRQVSAKSVSSLSTSEGATSKNSGVGKSVGTNRTENKSSHGQYREIQVPKKPRASSAVEDLARFEKFEPVSLPKGGVTAGNTPRTVLRKSALPRIARKESKSARKREIKEFEEG